jgi:hypothetical protein
MLGRGGLPIRAIVVHCLGMSLESYRSLMCDGTTSRTMSKHASMHYVHGDGGQVVRAVEETNVAWAFQSYPGNFPSTTPATTYPGLPVSAVYPGITADRYTLNIGIAVSSMRLANGRDACENTQLGLDALGYAKLVQNVAYLAAKYSIPLDDQHIVFEDDVIPLAEGDEECKCSHTACLVCDVAAYCETCTNVGDSTIKSGTLAWVYGENADGCKAKMTVAQFKALLATIP